MDEDSQTRNIDTREEKHDESHDLLGLTDAVGGLDAAEPGHDPLLGHGIGGVKIVKLIAEGGMGRVYEGLQEKPRRTVAVKVMRPGAVSREACRRFDNESEVLGRLRHPYIAQVYSAGICTVMGAEIPYFTMEFIPDALPITKFAAAKKLSTNERIELFRKVCEAVAHGHDKNVIHRDLKPSNILVEPNGVPKIIDFGIARCVDASPEVLTGLTDIGQLIGTVQYMSPEQFEADPTKVDVRTDVYALGVILYELLAGKPPYEIRQKEIFEAARVVRECKPVSPAKFNSHLTADVVRITGTCLQKDRRRRYANALELKEALAASLVGAPIRDPNPAELRSVIARAGSLAKTILGRGIIGLTLAGLVASLTAWLFWSAPVSPVSSPEMERSFQFNGHSYRIVLEPVTRAEAVRKCEEKGGHLARISTETENKKVFAAAEVAGLKDGQLWIDGIRHGEHSKWAYGDASGITFFYRGLNRLVVDTDASSHALAIVIDAPIAYWVALDDASRVNGFVCEWEQ